MQFRKMITKVEYKSGNCNSDIRRLFLLSTTFSWQNITGKSSGEFTKICNIYTQAKTRPKACGLFL